MKIASIITSFTNGGAEMLVTNLSEAFVKLGHQSTILSLCNAADLDNSVEAEKTLMAKVENAGGVAISAEIRNRRNIIIGAKKLRKVLAAIKPDIIHVHTARALLMLMLAGVKTPIILTHHNSVLSFPAFMFRLFDHIVKAYVAISSDCVHLIEASANNPVTLIRNAAGAGFYADGPKKLTGDHFQILLVGAISAQKDYPAIIRAAPILRKYLAKTGQSANIEIAGGGTGDDIADLRHMAKSFGVGDMITFLGNRDDVHDLIKKSDVFVNCSRYEGMPVAIIEAMSSGLPIVAANVSGNRELVQSEHNGLLVTAQKPQRLADGIFQILSNPKTYNNMSRAALKQSKGYSITSSAKAHLKLYQSVLSNIRTNNHIKKKI